MGGRCKLKTDEQLYHEIIEKLNFSPEVNTADLAVSVHNGIATLGGSVVIYSEKIAAQKALLSIEGIKGIINDIKITPAACRSDADIAKAAINNLSVRADIPVDNIKVLVDDGYLILEGEVTWNYQKLAAEEAVCHIFGVKGIANYIEIKPKAIIPIDLKEKILKEFERNALINANNIDVEIQGNKIILKGKVRNWAELLEAVQIAWSAPGVKEVDERLTIL